MHSAEPVDLLITPRWMIPVEPYAVTLEDHAVAVRNGRIVAVCPRACLLYTSPSPRD